MGNENNSNDHYKCYTQNLFIKYNTLTVNDMYSLELRVCTIIPPMYQMHLMTILPKALMSMATKLDIYK